MTEAAVVFVAQYLMVLLLGLQSLNVRDRHYVLAGITSFMLGVCGFYVTSIVGAAKGQVLTILWWSFVIAGPCGIITAMAVHPALVRAWEKLR
jgi:hypothetical protein